MQKLIGALLILTATAGAGYVYCGELKRYLGTMIYLRYVMSLIRGEIGYSHSPLPEVFKEVAGRVRQPYKMWLSGLAEEMEKRNGSGFGRIWNRQIERSLSVLKLKREHSILMKEPGTFLGSLDRPALDRTMELYLNRMDLEIEKLREGIASKTRIGRCLGIMSGIFLIVLLL